MKTIASLALAAVMACPCISYASGSVNLQGTVFDADTVAHYYIGPGATHTHLHLSASGRNIEVFVLTLDKSDPTYTPAAVPKVIIGHDRCRDAESVSSMAARHTTDNQQILAGVNGDFFITSQFAAQHEFGNRILGYPNMACVIDGKLAAPDMIDITSRENALIIANDGMWIDATDMSYTVRRADGSTINPTAMNYPRRDGEVMLYNGYIGATTGTDGGTEYVLVPSGEDKAWKINAPMEFTVAGAPVTGGNTAVPEGGAVLSFGPGADQGAFQNLADGEKVTLTVGLSLPAFNGITPDIQDVIGGDVRILKEGTVTTSAIRWINTPSAKYPRSLVGYSADRSKLVMVAVDGGSTISSGVSYYEGADLMAALGCHDALDFDGGGSTAMWTAHAGIVNRPRDGSERAVGNALYIALDAPADAQLSAIRFADHAATIPVYGSYKPVIYGYNRYGQLVDTAVSGIEFSIAEDVAEIAGGEVTIFNPGVYSLKAEKDGMSATLRLTVVEGGAVEAERTELLIDRNLTVRPRLRSLVEGDYMELSNAAFSWESSDGSVATVESGTGMIKGLSEGTAVVTGTRGDVSVELQVRVEIADGPLMPFADFCGEGWKVTKTGLSNLVAEGSHFSFDVSNSRNAALTIAKNLDAYSCPTALSMNLSCGGATLSAVTLKLRADNQSTPVNIKAENVGDGTVDIDLADYVDLADAYSFPLHFSSLKLEPGTAADGGKHFDITLSEVGFRYSDYNGSVRDVCVDGRDIPFRAEVTDGELTVAGADSVEIYDIAGRRLSTLPVAGVVIVRAHFGAAVRSGKVLL